jgi:hypothetical protein
LKIKRDRALRDAAEAAFGGAYDDRTISTKIDLAKIKEKRKSSIDDFI